MVVQAVRSILETMISSLPQFGNIVLLLFLVEKPPPLLIKWSWVLKVLGSDDQLLQAYSMFATFFVQEFGLTKFGLRLGPTAQFINFPNAMIACYQIVTAVSASLSVHAYVFRLNSLQG